MCLPGTCFTYWLLRYCLPGSRVWCVSPGASPLVTEISSSRRGSGCAFWARVRIPGCGGTAFQAVVCGVCLRGLHPRLSRYRLPDGGLGGVLVRGLHPRLWRYRLPDGGCGYAFRARVPHTMLLRYCLPGSCVWCVCPGAPPQVIEIPSSRRGAICTRVRFQTE